MKKIFTLIFSCAIFLAPHISIKAAASQPLWARVLNKTTYLYNSQDITSPCFLLPETYYVNIIGETGNFYLVRCQDEPRTILGYVLKEKLYICDYVPENPYLEYQVKVKTGAKAYLSSNTTATHDYVFNNGNVLYYYGRLDIEQVSYYFVSAFDLYRYYIKASDCESLSYALNADPLPIPENSNSNTTTPPAVTNPTPAKIGEKSKLFLILVLVVPALAATVYLFKPVKTPTVKDKYFYDENEYE